MSDTPTILKKILARKAEEVAERQPKVSIADLQQRIADQKGSAFDPRGFADSMAKSIAAGRSAVIAEAKKHSPSKGLLRDPFLRSADHFCAKFYYMDHAYISGSKD